MLSSPTKECKFKTEKGSDWNILLNLREKRFTNSSMDAGLTSQGHKVD